MSKMLFPDRAAELSEIARNRRSDRNGEGHAKTAD
jgi:hypothetical protein